MLTNELIKKIRRIQIRTTHLVSNAMAGQYHSAFKGRGMEFEEVRPYQLGDDVRTIDWNVSARTGAPHVKLFREERELTVMLAVDLSRSQFFGSNGQLKRELVAELAATIAFSAIRNNDKVGLLCFTDRVERYVPPRKGTRHVLRIIRELLTIQPVGRRTDISAAMDELNRVLKRRSVLFIVSDFQDSDYEHSLRIARRKHDVIPVIDSDQREELLPDVGLIELTDQESGQRVMVDTSSRKVRQRYAAARHEERASRKQAFRRMRLEPVEIRTGESFVEPLTDYFRKRERRRSR
ncbi:MAG: DUF58 domain-containing protein [Phycisphaerae bacterium]|nr:DUF58 domain-containing protein [Phycisphaerae bacterium]